MKKYEKVKSNLIFNEIINHGKKKSNKYFTIFSMASNDEKPKFGVAVPKRVGNAVVRNRLKRQTRDIIDKTKLMFKKSQNYIIIVKETCLKSSYQNKIDAITQLIGE